MRKRKKEGRKRKERNNSKENSKRQNSLNSVKKKILRTGENLITLNLNSLRLYWMNRLSDCSKRKRDRGRLMKNQLGSTYSIKSLAHMNFSPYSLRSKR